MTSLILLFALSAPGQADAADSESVAVWQVIREKQTAFQTIAFIYEGADRFVGPDRFLNGRPREGRDSTFQAAYALRSDGAALLDLYRIPNDPQSLPDHNTSAVLRGALTERTRTPDAKSERTTVVQGRNPMQFRRVFTPYEFLWTPYFQTIGALLLEQYQFQLLGWETRDGRRCALVRIDAVSVDMPDKPRYRLWIDVERDAHPIRIEFVRDAGVLRSVDVQLISITCEDGVSRWFPHRATERTYNWEGEVLTEPVLETTYTVVPTTVRINGELSDDVFQVNENRLWPSSEGLEQARERFAATTAPELPPMDPARVQERLDESLARADTQSRRLDASPPSGFLGTGISGLGLWLGLGLGLATIGLAVWFGRRAKLSK